jgi:thiopurine S-methyltransferase
MQPDFWHRRWQKNEIGFHLDEPNPHLVKYFNPVASGTVFVPLCGKSQDLMWLAKQQMRVVGVELSELACEAFFKENQLEPITVTEKMGFKIYEAGLIRIFCGDFFAITSELIGSFTHVYDRAALIALPPEMRTQYTQHLLKLIKEQNKSIEMLLITLFHSNPEIPGPPFSVEEAEVRTHYASSKEWVTLTTERDEDARSNPKYQSTEVFNALFRLRF